MTFVTYQFYIFFILTTLLYFSIPYKWRPRLILLASCAFYAALIPVYLLILFLLITIDYTTARLMERVQERARTHLLLISIISLCGILFTFKYFDFFAANVHTIAELIGWHYNTTLLMLALPLGLSFHTFQSLSYVIEVYRGKQPAEKNFFTYALYVMFYPQLVAGPIERPQQLLPQLHGHHTFNYERVKLGLIRMTWGLFKKTVIADHLGLAVTHVFDHPELHPGVSLIMAASFFTLQLYFDFSGYCDIALGAAQVLGITLVENFKQPFSSRSIAEWWRRWHISLSNWFRDYLYYPLVLSKKITPLRIYGTTLLTFLVMGLWHGANWTYVILGGLHGTYIIVGTMTQKWREKFHIWSTLVRYPKLHRTLQIATVFTLVTFSFIFFRAQTLSQALYIATHLFVGIEQIWNPLYLKATLLSNGLFIKAAAALPLALLVLWVESRLGDGTVSTFFARQKAMVRWAAYYALIIMFIFFNTGAGPGFIYFQF
jgi:D-alanyl-lipoteichoic acid acyltransferase DltB (MBOAT superfamily)